jgi:hypothetical protein
MLSAELSKLKCEDMGKVHNRAKRLENRKKAEIIDKEKDNSEKVVEIKKTVNTLVNLRF